MKLDWTKDVSGDPDAISARRELVNNSSLVLGELRKVLERKLREVEATRQAKPDYAQTSWAYLQADLNGEIRGIKYVLSLLDLEG